MGTLELISTSEAARLIGKDVSTINRWCASGKLTPAFKLDGRTGAYLFHREDVEALANEDVTSNA